MATETTVDWEAVAKRLQAEVERRSMTVQEAGRKGGLVVKDKYGPAHYERIGKLGGAAVARERGAEFYRRIGKLGGAKVAAQRGVSFYQDIGRKGGNAVKAKAGPTYYADIGKRGGRPPSSAGGDTTGGAALRAMREGAGLTQSEMAQRLSVRQPAICNVERGRANYNVARWRERYERALGA